MHLDFSLTTLIVRSISGTESPDAGCSLIPTSPRACSSARTAGSRSVNTAEIVTPFDLYIPIICIRDLPTSLILLDKICATMTNRKGEVLLMRKINPFMKKRSMRRAWALEMSLGISSTLTGSALWATLFPFKA